VVVGDLQLPKTESSDKSSNAADSKASQICYQRCDITNWSSLCALFDKAKSTFGRVDFVHANAAINDYGDPFFSLPSASPGGPLTEPDLRTIDINVKGTINTVALAMHHLKQNQKGSDGVAGSVVITASLAGYYATEGMPLYSAAKHGRCFDPIYGDRFLANYPCSLQHLWDYSERWLQRPRRTGLHCRSLRLE
jgi:NAD(P)-dependent dehydrogenase (short-subunit alcohol dehydrogenase family)